jgi:hypothetical protein
MSAVPKHMHTDDGDSNQNPNPIRWQPIHGFTSWVLPQQHESAALPGAARLWSSWSTNFEVSRRDSARVLPPQQSLLATGAAVVVLFESGMLFVIMGCSCSIRARNFACSMNCAPMRGRLVDPNQSVAIDFKYDYRV